MLHLTNLHPPKSFSGVSLVVAVVQVQLQVRVEEQAGQPEEEADMQEQLVVLQAR